MMNVNGLAINHGRKATGAYLNHVSIANGSLMEVETFIQIAGRLGYLTSQQEANMPGRTDEIGKMLSGLQKSLNPRSSILPHDRNRSPDRSRSRVDA